MQDQTHTKAEGEGSTSKLHTTYISSFFTVQKWQFWYDQNTPDPIPYPLPRGNCPPFPLGG